MTYPPPDVYKEDMKKTKGILRIIFSKNFLIAAIATVMIYKLIDMIITWMR